MFFPVGDRPNPATRPWVTWLLLAVNLGVFLALSLPLMNRPADPSSPLFREFIEVMQRYGGSPQHLRETASAYDLFVFQYGFRPAEFAVADLFTSLFLHANLLHLGGNLLFLWIFGNNVEARLGRAGYLVAYIATGVAATLFFSLFAGDSPLPVLGASGAISGVLGCYFWWFPDNKVRLFLFLFPLWAGFVEVSARLVLGIYLLVDNLLPFLLRGGAATGVAHGAHIGGFAAGLLLAVVLGKQPHAAGR